MLNITKIAIYPQRFDRSLRNLVRCCKMGLLTAPTVKKIEFQKSKMADGRHFKNRYIILSQQPFDWFFVKFGTVMHVDPHSLAGSAMFSAYVRTLLNTNLRNYVLMQHGEARSLGIWPNCYVQIRLPRHGVWSDVSSLFYLPRLTVFLIRSPGRGHSAYLFNSTCARKTKVSRISHESHAVTPHSGNLTHFSAQRKTIFLMSQVFSFCGEKW